MREFTNSGTNDVREEYPWENEKKKKKKGFTLNNWPRRFRLKRKKRKH